MKGRFAFCHKNVKKNADRPFFTQSRLFADSFLRPFPPYSITVEIASSAARSAAATAAATSCSRAACHAKQA